MRGPSWSAGSSPSAIRRVPLVEDRGTFSLRGDILDLYPPTGNQPVRIEFFGDWIERMRPFDTAGQRTGNEELRELLLLPAREMILAGEHLDTFARRVKERCDALEIGRQQREAVLEEAREGLLTPGRGFLLPFNYDRLDTFFEHAPAGIWAVLDPPAVEQEADRFAAEIREGEKRAASRGEPYAAAADLYLEPAVLEHELRGRRRIDFAGLQVYRLEGDRQLFHFRAEGNGDLRADTRQEDGGMSTLAARLRQWRQAGWQTLLVCHQRGQAERLLDLLAPYSLAPVFAPEAAMAGVRTGELRLVLGDLSAGFRLPDEKLAVVTEEEIFGQRVRRRGAGEARVRALLSSLAELKDRRLRRACRSRHRPLPRSAASAAWGRSKGIFCTSSSPVTTASTCRSSASRRCRSTSAARGIRRASTRWAEAPGRRPSSRRAPPSRSWPANCSSSMPNARWRRVSAIPRPTASSANSRRPSPTKRRPTSSTLSRRCLADMQSERPMDRLICGDVGYGKTEVAIRAAFKAVLDGRQVAVLVPTTILARQHWETFRARFDGLSGDGRDGLALPHPGRTEGDPGRAPPRARSTSLSAPTACCRRDVRFKDLGLVIVDEEQRFGVSHKERLKKLRAEVDLLTLTATPIPRTLHMSLMGLRDLSVIDTPPVDRLAIRTYVTRFDDDLIREAILRELRRGGQVFFVHNRVQIDRAPWPNSSAPWCPRRRSPSATGRWRRRHLKR